MILGKAGHNWIYFTSHDLPEPTHVHANYPKRIEPQSAKIWVYRNGETKIAAWGNVSTSDMREIQAFIKDNFMRLFKMWEEEFKVLHIYGEPDINFTVESGSLELKIPNQPRDLLTLSSKYKFSFFDTKDIHKALIEKMLNDGCSWDEITLLTEYTKDSF